MTRFMGELNGSLGEYWKAEAEKELARVKTELEAGEITIDENGVARNCVGRALMDDMLERLTLVTDRANTEATRAVRCEEDAIALAEYRRNKKPPTEAEKAEMRASFGEGITVVDILTGEKTIL